MAQPYRYASSPLSTAPPPPKPDFIDQAWTAWTLGPTNQAMLGIEGWVYGGLTKDPAFDPWANMKGYEIYAPSLVWAQSAQQMDWMKSQIDFNNAEKAKNSGGIMGGLAQLAGGMLDPINLIPIPVTRGMGFVRGGAVGMAAGAGIAAVTDPVRILADPTADWNELAYSIGGAALFGGALGGLSGSGLSLSRKQFLKGQFHGDRLILELGEMEGTNVGRDWNAAEENYDVVTGATGLLEDGRYEPVKVDVVETTVSQKQGPDGNLYHYDDALGWVLEADRGNPDPRPVGQDIVDALGVPERVQRNRMTVDEAAIKKDFEEGRTGLPEGEVRSSREYVTFKQIEAVWKKREPQRPGETRNHWLARIRDEALREMKGRRASSSVARNSALAQVLDRLNFSPVAKAIRLFKHDNIMGDLPLELAGDYGWAIRANEFGYKTPPSLLLRSMRHNVAFNEIRQATDAAYVKFAQRNAAATGKTFMGHNVTAAAEGLKARMQALGGGKAVTKEIFARMAGRAVFEKGDFEIDGVKVVPEAREAAQAWTRIAQNYDREARELGIFYDQQSLRRTRQEAAAKAENLRSRMASWLWGATSQPEALVPAIRVKVRVNDFAAPDAGIYDGFHGSTKGFTSFDRSRLGEFTGAQSAKEGFFFSKTAETANTYSEYWNLDKVPEPLDTSVIQESYDNITKILDDEIGNLRFDVDFALRSTGLKFDDYFTFLNDKMAVTDYDYDNLSEVLTDDELRDVLTPEQYKIRTDVHEAMGKVREIVKRWNDQTAENRALLDKLESDLLWANFQPESMADSAPTGASVHPVKLVMRNPYVFDQRGEHYRERRFTDIVLTAKREGHDSAIIKNTYDTWGGEGEALQDDIYIVFSEEQIVSNFDRERLAEANTLGDREVEQVFTGETHSDALLRAIEAGADTASAVQGFIPKAVPRPAAPKAEPWKAIPNIASRKFETRLIPKEGGETRRVTGTGSDQKYFIGDREVGIDEWLNQTVFGDKSEYQFFIDGKEVPKQQYDGAFDLHEMKVLQNLQDRYLAGDPMVEIVNAGDDPAFPLWQIQDKTSYEAPTLDLDPNLASDLRDKRRNAEDGAAAAEAKAAREEKARIEGRFIASDRLSRDRESSLTEAQRRVYDDMLDQLDRHEQAQKAAELALTHMEETPHTFRDQYGEQEPFFARFWNHTQISSERERFKALLTEWYRRENPAGAEQQAERIIDAMLKDGDSSDQRPASVPGLRHLAQRKLDIPNSFSAEHPQLGHIAASEFFNTDLEVVAEAYLRGMGHKIETARMFGDAGLWAKREDVISHFREKYLEPALKRGASTKEIEALIARRDEYMGWIDLIQRGISGGLKTKDPWTFDNRIARNLKNFQVLTSMGKVLITSIPEAMRLPMVNGFRTAFGALWDRAFVDYAKVKANVELSRETGELFDLVRDVHSARVAELNTPDPSGGGTTIERWLQKSVPGYFKLVGLTHWTVIAKDMLMFGAQHKVMDLAKRVDEPGNEMKLAAMGISRRDAKLLASMPVEQHGNLILPAVQNWTGPDAPRARQLLVDAIHGEARRAIVTPSFADRSLLFSGVLARKGRVVLESDIMTVPLQFLSYGLAASQKVAMSALQGRDQNALMGALAMMFLGTFSNYLKQPQTATLNKGPGEWLLEGYEASGVGAFWFSDLNQMIERYSNNTVGIRPTLGLDPRFGKTTNVGDYIDAAGPSVGTIYDVGSAFLDPTLTPSNRAQAIRRAVPYNNVLWWGSITRDLASKTAQQF